MSQTGGAGAVSAEFAVVEDAVPLVCGGEERERSAAFEERSVSSVAWPFAIRSPWSAAAVVVADEGEDSAAVSIASTSCLTISACPFRAAQCNGVFPDAFCLSNSGGSHSGIRYSRTSAEDHQERQSA